jgi:hypothetical protein
MDSAGVSSANMFTMSELVSQLNEILPGRLDIASEDALHPGRNVIKTQTIYFRMLDEFGLADKLAEREVR